MITPPLSKIAAFRCHFPPLAAYCRYAIEWSCGKGDE